MGVSFNQVPSTLRVPFAFIEFDNSGAILGSAKKNMKALVLGQKLSAGSAAALSLNRATSADQAMTLFGRSAMLHLMAKSWFANNPFTETYFLPLADAGAGVAATGSFAFTGTATEAGTFVAYIGGKRVAVAVTVGMTAAQLATALTAAIGADAELPVSAETATATTNVTCKWKGETGNAIDLRHSYYDGEKIPAGLAVTVTAMASGATNPDLAAIIAVIAGQQFDVIVCPYTDAANLTVLKTELASRWGPLVQQEGFACIAKDDTLANLQTFGAGQNTQFLSCPGIKKSPTPSFQVAAAYGAVLAYYSGIDPARPFQTLPLVGVLPPAIADRFTLVENNSLLYSGIATLQIDAGGNVCIQRAISMYQKNGAGADDPSYLDMTTLFTLAYFRYSLRTRIQLKYPRHKLADDGGRYSPGQAIITPKVAKAEIVALAREWESDGLAEGIDAFKESLIVERNTGDRNRLDIMLRPDVVNGFVVAGVQIKFIL